MTGSVLSTANAESTALMNVSAKGLQKGLLELLQAASLKRLSRIVNSWQSCQLQLAVNQWHHVSKHNVLSERHQNIREKNDNDRDNLAKEHAREIAEVRQEWKKRRDEKVQEIGFPQEDHIAVGPDDVKQLRELDKSFREKLYKVQQAHLDSADILDASCTHLQKDCSTKVQSLALFGLATQMAEKQARSRAALGRTWQLSDMDTGILQWAFTVPPDPCMVPFFQAVAMEDQQEVLAQTCRLIFEYADKLPRWGQLASVNQGHLSKCPECALAAQFRHKCPECGASVNRGRTPSCPKCGAQFRHKCPATAGANLLKSVLRRLQARCGLQLAFQRFSELSPRTPRQHNLGRAAWQRVSTAVRSVVRKKRELAKQDQAMAKLALRHRAERQRKSLHITPVEEGESITRRKERAATTMAVTSRRRRMEPRFSDDDPEESSAASPGAYAMHAQKWDDVVQATQRRLSRHGDPTPPLPVPFLLGEDESAVRESTRRPSVPSSTLVTPRTRAVTDGHIDRQKSSQTPGSPDFLPWADETPGGRGSRTPMQMGKSGTEPPHAGLPPDYPETAQPKMSLGHAALHDALPPSAPHEGAALADASRTSQSEDSTSSSESEDASPVKTGSGNP